MANTIPNIQVQPDLGSTSSAQAASGGGGASASDATSQAAASTAATAKAPVQATDPNSTTQAASAQSNPANLRLEIDDDKAAGCFVYKIINRATGEVVMQVPQEQIVKLRESDAYLAGDLIKAQA